MPVKRKLPNKESALKMEVIRKQNKEIQRYARIGGITKIRDEIKRHTANRNYQMELGRLREASLRHSGLDVPGLNRMHELKSRVLVK